MAEELLPINNISYHFIKKVNGIISEKVIQTTIICNNFDELLNDLKTKKEFVHKNKYSDIYITCSSLNKDVISSSYLWHTDYVNSTKIYKLSLFDIIMNSKQSTNELKKNTKTIPIKPEQQKNIPKENKPEPFKFETKKNEPDDLELSDILKIFSQKLSSNNSRNLENDIIVNKKPEKEQFKIPKERPNENVKSKTYDKDAFYKLLHEMINEENEEKIKPESKKSIPIRFNQYNNHSPFENNPFLYTRPKYGNPFYSNSKRQNISNEQENPRKRFRDPMLGIYPFLF